MADSIESDPVADYQRTEAAIGDRIPSHGAGAFRGIGCNAPLSPQLLRAETMSDPVADNELCSSKNRDPF